MQGNKWVKEWYWVYYARGKKEENAKENLGNRKLNEQWRASLCDKFYGIRAIHRWFRILWEGE